MPSLSLNPMQTSPAALPGTWKLGPGNAVTLRPREAGVLQVTHGRVWATYDGPHSGPSNDLGDRVVGVGGQLPLQAGQRLVLEAWSDAPAFFSWQPLGIIPRWPAPSHPSTSSSAMKSWT